MRPIDRLDYALLKKRHRDRERKRKQFHCGRPGCGSSSIRNLHPHLHAYGPSSVHSRAIHSESPFQLSQACIQSQLSCRETQFNPSPLRPPSEITNSRNLVELVSPAST